MQLKMRSTEIFNLVSVGALVLTLGSLSACSYVSYGGDWPDDQSRFEKITKAGPSTPLGPPPGVVGRSTIASSSEVSPTHVASSGGYVPTTTISRTSPPAAQPYRPDDNFGRARLNENAMPLTSSATKSAQPFHDEDITPPTTRVGSTGLGSASLLPPARTDVVSEVEEDEAEADEPAHETRPQKKIEPVERTSKSAKKVSPEKTSVVPGKKAKVEEPKDDLSALKDDQDAVNEGEGDVTEPDADEDLAPDTTEASAKIVTNLAIPPAKTENTKSDKAATETSKGKASSTGSLPAAETTIPGDETQCAKADDEAGRGESAASDADRLFYYRRALRLCPNRAKFRVEIGKIYAGLGRVEDAEHEFRQALDAEPTNAEAKGQLKQLEQK